MAPGPVEVSIANRIDLEKIPVAALNRQTRQLLSALLNPKRTFLTEDGCPRDWRGLYRAIGMQDNYFSLLQAHTDPTTWILEYWSDKPAKCMRAANLKELQFVLGTIDRWDVLDDTAKLFNEDAEQFLEQQYREANNQETVATAPITLDSDADIITRHDTRDYKRQYDTFLLYDAKDIDIASMIIERLEKRNVLVCVKDRDILGGISFEHDAIMRLISERCRRLVVIVTKSFIRSPLNDFLVTFAQALQIEQKQRKIIPCVFGSCELPANLKFYFCLRYQNSEKLYNFWDKLEESIREKPSAKALADVQDSHKPEMALQPLALDAPKKVSPIPSPVVFVDLPESETKSPVPISTAFVEKVTASVTAVQQPTVNVEDIGNRSTAIQKSTSFWEINRADKKEKLKPSTSQVCIATGEGDAAGGTNERDKGESKKRWYSSLLTTFSSSNTHEKADSLKGKFTKSKSKPYKAGSKKIATAV